MVFFKKLIFVIQFLCILPVQTAFVAGTLVRTADGFVPIENIQKNNSVVCFDKHNNIAVKPILCIHKKSVKSHIKIYCDDFSLGVSNDQLFYSKIHNEWVEADKLCVNDFLCASDGRMYAVRHIEYSNEPIELYCLFVKDCHNFCVTSSEIIVHNFVPIVMGVVWAFGAGGIELVSLGIGFLGGTLIGYSQYKKHQQAKSGNTLSIGSFGGNMFPEDPNDDDDELTQEEKKKQRDEAHKKHRPLTNKEARAKAKELGYTEAKDHPASVPENALVFKKGNKYISPDLTGHKGGMWKMFNRQGARIATWDMDLIRKIGR